MSGCYKKKKKKIGKIRGHRQTEPLDSSSTIRENSLPMFKRMLENKIENISLGIVFIHK